MAAVTASLALTWGSCAATPCSGAVFKCFCDGLISIEQEAAGIIKTRVIEIAVKVAVKGT